MTDRRPSSTGSRGLLVALGLCLVAASVPASASGAGPSDRARLMHEHLGHLEESLTARAPWQEPVKLDSDSNTRHLVRHLRALERLVLTWPEARADGLFSRLSRLERRLSYDRTGRDVAMVRAIDDQLGPSAASSESAATGAIAGRVVDAATGLGIEEIQVEVYDSDGRNVGRRRTDTYGRYFVLDLARGSYFVVAYPFNAYIGQLHDGLPCPSSSCDPTTGQVVVVEPGSIASGVDFRLSVGGVVSGRVTDAASGEPIQGAVTLWSEAGIPIGTETARLEELGRYSFGGLLPGNYYATAESVRTGRVLFDGLPCPDPCTVAVGTPIEVLSADESGGVDFSLSQLGVISGTIRSGADGEPLPFVSLQVWTSNGNRLRDGVSGPDGTYLVGGLKGGSYFVTTTNFVDHLDEAYDGLPCWRGDCEPTDGTPVVVVESEVTEGIDFALRRGGRIAGTVTARRDGRPLKGIDVDVWSRGGQYLDSGRTDAAGRYSVGGLTTGEYLVTAGQSDFLREAYDGMACEDGPLRGCDPTSATPTGVGEGNTTEGIDFALRELGKITGNVHEEGLVLPIANVGIRVWDSGGNIVTQVHTEERSGGDYVVTRLRPGTYFLTTSNQVGYQDEIYHDLPCDGGIAGTCDPQAGVGIAVDTDVEVTGIDFALRFTGIGRCPRWQTVLCLQDDRFRVEVDWRDFEGQTGFGQRWSETADTGLFWFFDEDNLELTVKVLDACAVFGRFWIFAAGMTNVQYDLRVTDLATGMTKIYSNPLGRVAETIIDTDTFGCSVPEGSRPTR